MRSREEWRCGLSIMAAIAGTGIMPGRAVALFFGQLKGAAPLGIVAASVLFGGMVCFALRRRQQFGRLTACGHSRGAGILGMLRGLFLALLCAVMLARAGAIGALTLPVKHAYVIGAALALCVGMLAQLRREAALSIMGMLVTLGVMLFYAALALDARPTTPRFHGETELRLADSAGAALALAIPFSAMNACAASLADCTAHSARPGRVGAMCGLILFAVLTLGCLALRRGGDALLAQPMPWVVLSARWGLPGFWICAALEYLCALSTAAAALGGVTRVVGPERGKRFEVLSVVLLTLLIFGILAYGSARAAC